MRELDRKGHLDDLPGMAAIAGWATPVAGAAHKETTRSKQGIARQTPLGTTSSSSNAETEKPGQLNPEFVCWLMGFPVEWLFAAPLNKAQTRFKKRTNTQESER